METYSLNDQLRYHDLDVLNPKIVFPTIDFKYKIKWTI